MDIFNTKKLNEAHTLVYKYRARSDEALEQLEIKSKELDLLKQQLAEMEEYKKHADFANFAANLVIEIEEVKKINSHAMNLFKEWVIVKDFYNELSENPAILDEDSYYSFIGSMALDSIKNCIAGFKVKAKFDAAKDSKELNNKINYVLSYIEDNDFICSVYPGLIDHIEIIRKGFDEEIEDFDNYEFNHLLPYSNFTTFHALRWRDANRESYKVWGMEKLKDDWFSKAKAGCFLDRITSENNIESI